MRCNNCGYDNADPSIKNCVKCGYQLTASAPVASYTPKAYSSESKETRVLAGDINSLGGGASLKQTVMQGMPSNESQQLKQTVMQGMPSNESQQLKQTVMQGMPSNLSQQQLKQTVVQGVFDNEPLQVVEAEQNDLCPKCSYPLSDGYCARCGYDRNSEGKADDEPEEDVEDVESPRKLRSVNRCQHCNNEVPANYQFCPFCGNMMDVGTVIITPDRHLGEVADTKKPDALSPHFRLIMIADEDESISEEEAVREFNGDSVVLNRANTDPGNRTITSKEQAIMAFEDGHWTIVNQSQRNPTLVVANRKIELQSGDVIMLGDRQFRFELES